MYSYTLSDLNQAINAVTARVKTERQRTCVEFAATWVSRFGGSAWSLKVDRVLITSTSKGRSGRTYTLTLGDQPHCTCPATVPCKHLAIACILKTADQIRKEREAQAYGFNVELACCGGQGCHLCMEPVEPAAARLQLAAAIITNECPEEMLTW